MNKYFEKVRIIELPKCVGGGKSIAIESMKDVPFAIKRVFYIFGGNNGIVRGKHANRRSKFILFNVSGTTKVRIVDEKKKKREYYLDSPGKALYLPEMVWKEMYDFSEDSVLMALTDKYYDPDEYIRDFDLYVKLIKETER